MQLDRYAVVEADVLRHRHNSTRYMHTRFPSCLQLERRLAGNRAPLGMFFHAGGWVGQKRAARAGWGLLGCSRLHWQLPAVCSAHHLCTL